MIFSVVATITPQYVHAETSIDQETKVRNAVVHQLLLMEDKLKPKHKEDKKVLEVSESITKKIKEVDAPDIDNVHKSNRLERKKEVAVIDSKKAQDIKQTNKTTQDENLKTQQTKAKNDEKTKNIPLKDKKEVAATNIKKAPDSKKVTPNENLKAQRVKAKKDEKTKNITLKDKKEVVSVDVKKTKKMQETKQADVAKDDNLKIKQIISKKTPQKEPVENKKSDPKRSFTPLVDILSEEELQALMQDVVLSPSSSKTENAAIKPIVESSTKGKKNNVTTLTDEKKTDDSKKASSTSTDTDKSKVASTDATETDNKTTDVKPQSIPVGRQELGRNIKSEPPSKSNQKTVTKKTKGWIYLGKFKSNQWENQTLDIDKELPKVGTQYTIKATMVNVRDRLPKKGKMGKVITAIKQKQTVNILQLQGLGRNRIYYWAKIEHEKGNLRVSN
jgi:hypothetical protein